MNSSFSTLILSGLLSFFIILQSVTTSEINELNRTIYSNVRAQKTNVYRADWNNKGRWIGPAWWANPLWDWTCLGNGRVRARASSNRALTLLPFELVSKGGSFTFETTVKFIKTSRRVPYLFKIVSAGFALGRTGPMKDYRSAAVYSKSELRAVVTSSGKLSIGYKISSKSLPWISAPITLTLKGTRHKDNVKLLLTARQFKHQISLSSIVSLKQVTGTFAIVTNGPGRTAEELALADVIFERFSVTGSMLKKYNNRMYGGVMWSQYTISQKTLRLQAQLAPIEKPVLAKLIIRGAKGEQPVQTKWSWSEGLSRTVRFVAYNWKSQRSWHYEVQVKIYGRLHTSSGVIQREPPYNSPFKIAAFSCDEGYMFPLSSMVKQVYQQKPDLVYFAGDQMYYRTAGFSMEQYAKTHISMLDFLRRWYLFGWTWRQLLQNTPSIILPDDHDVFQGNLFGDGGRAMKKPKGRIWSSGGYIMPGPWVVAVEKCHTGHLPPSRASFKTPLGLRPYFTSLIYGGLSMAVLEDRKFKSAPKSFSLSKRLKGNGGHLLGLRQEAFLKKWVKEWKGASMKVAFSQTIFCNVATHAGYHLNPLGRDFDGGGWPYTARNRAVKLLGEGRVLTLHGDQHLGILLRQGVKKHDDAGVSFMVPGTANGYSRAWWPGVKTFPKATQNNFTGKFLDGMGHPVTVLAVGNPEPKSSLLDTKGTAPRLRAGRAKGSGYGLVVLNRKEKTATFYLYKVGKNYDQFKGFPKKVFIGGKP